MRIDSKARRHCDELNQYENWTQYMINMFECKFSKFFYQVTPEIKDLEALFVKLDFTNPEASTHVVKKGE